MSDNVLNTILETIKSKNIKFIQLIFTDILGNPKSCTIAQNSVKTVLSEGCTFDGSSIKGYSSIMESDLFLMPDLNTFKVLPENFYKNSDRCALVICDILDGNKKPYSASPRAILKKIIEKARNLNYKFQVSPELEFFFIKKNSVISFELLDQNGYCESSELDPTTDLKLEIMKTLYELDFMPERFHHEVAYSQHEITLRYDEALSMADKMVITKNIMRSLAQKYGYDITFMPKPIAGQNGSGMHINYSLFDMRKQTNLFFDKDKKYYLSDLAKFFIAGNLTHIKDFSAILNPTINSYKRLVKGYEAPIYICWGAKNRSSLIRIPLVALNQASATRAELRSPDGMANPYLAFATILFSGLDGIKNNIKIQNEVAENIYKADKVDIKSRNIDSLPESLAESLKILEDSSFAKSLFGEHFLQEYIKLKQQELLSFNLHVSNWEISKYL